MLLTPLVADEGQQETKQTAKKDKSRFHEGRVSVASTSTLARAASKLKRAPGTIVPDWVPLIDPTASWKVRKGDGEEMGGDMLFLEKCNDYAPSSAPPTSFN